MSREWRNWAGSVRFEPAARESPDSEEAVAEVVRKAAGIGWRVRAAGAGHSSSPLVRTHGVLVDPSGLSGLEDHDTEAGTATVGAGTRLHEVNELLFEQGLMMVNLGDVAYQAVAGAISTGTHGSGRRLTNLSGFVEGARLVSGTGEVVEISRADPEMLAAARVSLGCLGVLTSVTLRVLPSYRLERREWCASTEACLEHLPALMDGNRNFDFYWYPRRDDVKLRTWNPPGEGPDSLPFARCVKRMEGWGKDVLASEQPLRFHEMEYGLELDAGARCFEAIRKRVRDRHRDRVAWRILCRPVAADDGLLSNAGGRDTFAITVHQNASLPYREYFEDLEPIFRDHGGRPHWGKRHTMHRVPEALRALYPEWDRFMAVRKKLDPDGVFLSGYVRALLGLEDGTP